MVFVQLDASNNNHSHHYDGIVKLITLEYIYQSDNIVVKICAMYDLVG